MKKKILFALMILLLTGCSANYNINFEDEKIIDSIEIYENSSTINKITKEQEEELNNIILDWENGYDFYKKELYTTESVTGYKYTHEFTYDEYDAMSQLRKCYDEMNIINNSNNIKLDTSEEFNCATYYPDSKEMKINITSKYEIIVSNADTVNKNTHTWIINKTNYKNHPIEITISKKDEYKEEKENKFKFKDILVIIIFIILIIILTLRKRRNK